MNQAHSGRAYRLLAPFFVVLAFSPIVLLFQNCGERFEVKPELLSAYVDEFAIPDIEVGGLSALDKNSNPSFQIQISVARVERLKSLTCQLEGRDPVDCLSGKVTFGTLVDGDYKLMIQAETVSGIKSEAVRLFRIDATRPVVQLTTQPAALTNQTSASFVFAVTDQLSGVKDVECSLDGAEFGPCQSPVEIDSLSQGLHEFKVRGTDEAGNVSELTQYSWRIDLSKPTVTITGGPQPFISAGDTSVSFSGSGIASTECQLDNGAFGACSSPYAVRVLSQGEHVVKVRGSNLAGTVSETASISFTVDGVSPSQPLVVSSVPTTSSSKRASFTFHSNDDRSGVASYECSLDNLPYSTCTSPYSVAGLEDGSHVFSVRARDQAGNTSAVASYTWTIKAVVPQIIVTETPPNPQSTGSSTFKFVASHPDGLTSVTCQWVQGATSSSTPADCRSGSVTYSLKKGSYVFTIRAVSVDGDVSTYDYAWTISGN